MRKLLFPILLASVAATPALAAPGDHSDRQNLRAERQQAREERQEVREERQQVRENREQAREQRSVQAERPRPIAPALQRSGGNAEQDSRFAARVQALRAGRAQEANGNDRPNGARDARLGQRRQIMERRNVQADGLRQPNRPLPRVFRNRTPVVSDTPRVGTQPPLRVERRRTPEVRWSSNWRRDHRYDWRNWRDRHRSSFHLGYYYDPFGWGYQPYSIGWRLWPSYYSSNYWINDPWQYRLPYAPAGYRWVRYYDDAILVDTWSGQVVDVIYNFFW